MKTSNLNERRTTDFIPMSGVAAITRPNGEVRTIDAVGIFYNDGRVYVVHYDVDNPDHFVTTESSTGCYVTPNCYPDPESAYLAALGFLLDKKYFLATQIGNKLVSLGRNLRIHNTGLNNLLYELLL